MKEDLKNKQGKGRGRFHQTGRLVFKNAARWVVLGALFISVMPALSADTSMNEYQVKALCVLNFAKYTEWPANTFAETNTPISIGIVGDSRLGTNLLAATSGKTIGGRAIIVRELHVEADYSQCQILFVCASETKRIPEILDHVKNNSILTIGETEDFLRQGGVINFAVRSSKVRFDISLDAAHQAGLKLSSKVLSLADSVRGNP